MRGWFHGASRRLRFPLAQPHLGAPAVSTPRGAQQQGPASGGEPARSDPGAARKAKPKLLGAAAWGSAAFGGQRAENRCGCRPLLLSSSGGPGPTANSQAGPDRLGQRFQHRCQPFAALRWRGGPAPGGLLQRAGPKRISSVRPSGPSGLSRRVAPWPPELAGWRRPSGPERSAPGFAFLGVFSPFFFPFFIGGGPPPWGKKGGPKRVFFLRGGGPPGGGPKKPFFFKLGGRGGGGGGAWPPGAGYRRAGYRGRPGLRAIRPASARAPASWLRACR